MAYLVTFLEGIVTFLSPCLLPLLPVYLAFFAGGSGQGSEPQGSAGVRGQASDAAGAEPVSHVVRTNDDVAHAVEAAGGTGVVRVATDTAAADSTARSGVLRSLAGALSFVGGFTLVFVVLGVGSAAAGSLLLRYQRVLDLLCGGYVILMGLGQLGVVHIPWIDRMSGPGVGPKGRGLGGAFVFGMVFAVGWTPCVGTFLSSALSLAASSGSAVQGLVLLLCYCAGLGLPFVLAAVAIDQLAAVLAWVRVHQRAVSVFCGCLLVCVGLLMSTGTLGTYLRFVAFRQP